MSIARFARPEIVRAALASLLLLTAATSEARGQTIEVTVTALGNAAGTKPLPLGAASSLVVAVRNKGEHAAGPLTIAVRAEGMTLTGEKDWRTESGAFTAAVARLSAGARVERRLQLKIERAPLAPASSVIRVEVRDADNVVATGEAELKIADCVGAYRDRLAAIKGGLIEEVRNASEVLSKPDPALPSGRLFAPTRARGGPFVSAERLAASFAARRGGDAQMATEWFRFLILRWTSELNAYAGQSANAGLCANNYYQIAGYRQGLMPITKRIAETREAAEQALAAAREATEAEAIDGTEAVVRRAIKLAGLDADGGDAGARSALAVLVAARDAIARERPDADAMRALSLVETATWLAETDRRGQTLNEAIERVLSAIGTAHRETCVCAF